MKVSVIVANYNYEDYLPQAIESLLKQDYEDLEIVIVDDESVDNSREIIQALHHQHPNKIKYIFQKNMGHGGAIASAFAVSTGEIIAFLDSDDLWDSEKLSRVMPIFQADPNVSAVIHPLRMIDRVGNLMPSLQDVPVIPDGNLEKLLLETGAVWYYPPTSAITLRRQSLETLITIDVAERQTATDVFRRYPDGCLLYSAGFLGKVIPIPEILGSYRRHGANSYATDERWNSPTVQMQQDMLNNVEHSIQWINAFLAQLNKPYKVNIENNLNYIRGQYYLNSRFDWAEFKQISYTIMRWPFYDWKERGIFLIRFWLRNLKMLFNPKFTLVLDK